MHSDPHDDLTAKATGWTLVLLSLFVLWQVLRRSM